MKTKTGGKRVMDRNGDDDLAGVLMPCDTVVSNSVKAEITSSQPLMALDDEESALILNGEQKDVLATSLEICAERTQCTDEVENASEGTEVTREAPVVCAEEKECTNNEGDYEDIVSEGEEVSAEGLKVCVEENDSINGGLEKKSNEEEEMLDKALDVCAEEKEFDSGMVDGEESNIDIVANGKNVQSEMANNSPEIGDQKDALERTGEEGGEGAAHGNILGQTAEVKVVKASTKKIVNKLKRKRKVIKAKNASLTGSRVIPKSTSKSLKNKTDAAAGGETSNEMNCPGVDCGENVDGRMSHEEEKKPTNIDTGKAKRGGMEKVDAEVTNDNEADEMDNGKQVKATPKNNGKQMQKAKLRKKKKEVDIAAAGASGPRDLKEQASPPKKANKESKTMGMIFICASNTKNEVYHYKLMGMPASKRDLVLSIHEGMKLFLFDVNLKLLYGVYRAAGPGGYNIEPKAFKSAYPSQVRFAVEQDCLPIPEEKFKTIIKDNYYQKNKFKGELTLGQVNSLCKLFRATKNSNSKKLKKNIRQPPPQSLEKKDRNKNLQHARAQNSLTDRERNKNRLGEVKRPGPLAPADRDRPNKRRWEVERSGPQAPADRDRPNKRRWKDDRPRTHTFVNHDRSRQQHLEHERYPAHVRDVAFRDAPTAYERRSYVSSVAPLEFHPQLPAPVAPPSYAYDLNVGLNASRRQTLLERHDRSFIETDWRLQDIEYRRALDDYEQGRLRDSDSRRVGVEHLPYGERPSYYDQRYSTLQPAVYDTGRMQRDHAQPAYYDTDRMLRDPAAPRLDYESLRSTYRY